MSKYYEATGPVKDSIVEFFDRVGEARERARALCAKHGAEVGFSSGIGTPFGFKFSEAPNPKAWKLWIGSHYRPKRTAAGKAIFAEVEAIERMFPSTTTANKIIGMEFLSDGRWMTPGLLILKDKALVIATDDYEPKGEIAKNMKRISDLQFEKLTGGKKGEAHV